MRARLYLIPVCSWLVAPLATAQFELDARLLPSDGGVLLSEGSQSILSYAARTVALPDGYWDKIAAGNRIYARPRSGYLHPLYGPHGEEMTLDWSLDHPHHRGIYWAWPEVQWGARTGDLHALQKVYSRAVGDPRWSTLEEGAAAGALQLEAHNLWLWEDQTPVVFERVFLTAHSRQDSGVRAIDMRLEFEALVPDIRLARRGTDTYGGLNIRLAPVQGLKLEHYADESGSLPRRAWSLASGTWKCTEHAASLVVLEHSDNPDYPGDWITYKELPWFQPAFPKAGSRFELEPGKGLLLRYRFLVVPGTLSTQEVQGAWDAFHVAIPPREPESDAEKPPHTP